MEVGIVVVAAMVPINVLIEVEGRRKVLGLAEGTLTCLRDAFGRMCMNDVLLKSKLMGHHVLFKYFNTHFARSIEIEDNTVIEKDTNIAAIFQPMVSTQWEDDFIGKVLCRCPPTTKFDLFLNPRSSWMALEPQTQTDQTLLYLGGIDERSPPS